MGFINGVNCCLLVLGAMAIATHAFPAPGRAVGAGVLACIAAVILRAAAPVPDAVRPLLPVEALIIAVVALGPRALKSVPIVGALAPPDRRNGVATGVGVGRFVFEHAAKLWAALAVPGFTWAGVSAAAMLGVHIAVAHLVLAAALKAHALSGEVAAVVVAAATAVVAGLAIETAVGVLLA